MHQPQENIPYTSWALCDRLDNGQIVFNYINYKFPNSNIILWQEFITTQI